MLLLFHTIPFSTVTVLLNLRKNPFLSAIALLCTQYCEKDNENVNYIAKFVCFTNLIELVNAPSL